MENENLEPENFDESQFQEPNEPTINIGEAFDAIFQKESWLKVLGVIALILLPIALVVLTSFLFGLFAELKNPVFGITGIVIAIITVVSIIFSSLVLYGYFLLYAHDRALRKDALYRVWSGDTIKESVIAGLKSYVMGIVQVPFVILAIPLLIATYLIMPNDDLLNFVCDFFFAVVVGVPIAKIFAYFMKDMNPVSLFKWGEAFRFTKGVKGVFWVPVVPFVFTWAVSAAITFILMGLSQVFIGVYNYRLISGIVALIDIPFAIIGAILYCNLLGQYTYNAIKRNENIDPETVPNTISKDGTAVVVVTVAAVYILIILAIAAALVIPSLINRQSDLAATVKMKKAIANYEDVAAVYLIENTPKGAKNAEAKPSLKGLTGKNCENLNNYFKVISQQGCSFTTADGVYWEFDPEKGSAIILDSGYNARYAVQVGQCKDGTINCADEYPDVSKILNK